MINTKYNISVLPYKLTARLFAIIVIASLINLPFFEIKILCKTS